MNSAMTTKVRAMSQNPRNSPTLAAKDIVPFLKCPKEKSFINSFAKGIETDDKGINYYINLWTKLKLLNPNCKTEMKNIIGSEIDLKNILWAYRLKKFYAITGNATYGYLIPLHYKLSLEICTSIAHCTDAESLMKIVEDTVYNGVFRNFSNPEEQLRHFLLAKYKQAGKKSHIALACGYISSHGNEFSN